MFDQNNAERTIFSESKLIFSRRLKIKFGGSKTRVTQVSQICTEKQGSCQKEGGFW